MHPRSSRFLCTSDTKNSEGIVAQCIEEIAHNAVAIRWNPLEQPAKVSLIGYAHPLPLP